MVKAITFRELNRLHQKLVPSDYSNTRRETIDRQIAWVNRRLLATDGFLLNKFRLVVIFGTCKILPEVITVFRAAGFDVKRENWEDYGWVLDLTKDLTK